MSRETMINLKPCPFCGRNPTVDDCGDHRYFVRCKCGIAQDKLYTQRCDAVRHWNDRKTVDKDLYDLVREQRDIAAGSVGLIYARYGENFDDVVKVVRCKDCVHWMQKSPDDKHYCDVFDWLSTKNDYCSFAERREE